MKSIRMAMACSLLVAGAGGQAHAQSNPALEAQLEKIKPFYAAVVQYAFMGGACQHLIGFQRNVAIQKDLADLFEGSSGDEVVATMKEGAEDAFKEGTTDPVKQRLDLAGCDKLLKETHDEVDVEVGKIRR